MEYRERREIIELSSSSARRPSFRDLVGRSIEHGKLWVFARRLAKVRTGSERWHIIQEKVSRCPSVGIAAKRRAYFYHRTLPRCGDELYVHPGVVMYFPMNIELGNRVFMNRGVFITASAKVSIGNDVLIGPYTVINSGNHVYRNSEVPIRQQGHVNAPIVIEDDVWIGAHAVVLPGVRIGRGAVVGAGAVVTRDVDRYAVVVGVPATTLRYRKPAPETVNDDPLEAKYLIS